MAVLADANSEHLGRTSGTFYTSATFSGLIWAYLEQDRNASGAIWGMRVIPGGDGTYAFLYNLNGDGTTFVFEMGHTTGSLYNATSGPNMSLNTWYCFAWVRAGTGSNQLTLRYRTAAQTAWTASSTTHAGGTFTPTDKYILSNGFNLTSGWFGGRLAGLKEWNAALTAEELLTESLQYQPVRFTNLQAWYPLLADTVANAALDYSTGQRPFTVTGALTIAEGPPIPWSLADDDDDWALYASAVVPPSVNRRRRLLMGAV